MSEMVSMILNIALKEFYTNLISARFFIGFLLCLFLVPFTLFVSINDYDGQVRAYETERKEAEESMKVWVYSALRPEIVKPPEPLSIFSRGVSFEQVPVFQEKPASLGERLSYARIYLLITLLYTAVAFILSFVLFLKYDVR